MDAAPFVVIMIMVVVVVGFGMYSQGRTKGYAEGKALHAPLVTALENQVKSYAELIDALNRQVKAQKDQIESQSRLISMVIE